MDVNLWDSEKESRTASVVKMVFWNSGTETIAGGDWPDMAPLLIEVDGGVDILNVEITYASHGANEVRVAGIPISDDENATLAIGIEFDYLDPGEGFAVRLAHGGVEDHGVAVTGKLKGAGRLKEWNGLGDDGKAPFGAALSRRAMGWMIVPGLLVVIGMSFFVVGLSQVPLSGKVILGALLAVIIYLAWKMSAAGSIPWPLRRYLLLKPEVTREAPIE